MTSATSGPDRPTAGPPPWSWRRALLHAGIVAGALVLVGALVAASGLVKDPRRFGEGLGRFVFFAGGAAFAVSYLAQTGRRRVAWGLALGFVALIGALVSVLLLHSTGGRGADRLTPADRADLQLDVQDDRRLLRHPSLGFTIRHPGPSFQTAPEVARSLAGSEAEESLHAWGFLETDTGDALAVMLARGIRAREEVDGFLGGIREAVGRVGATVLREDVSWTDTERALRLDISLASGHLLVLRGLGAELGPEHASYLVAAMAMTTDPSRAVALVESLRLPGPPGSTR